MNELGTFISTVGFPITVSCAIGYGFYKVIKTLLDEGIVALKKITQANEELVKTNSIIVNKLEGRIDNIDEKLDKVLDLKRGDV